MQGFQVDELQTREDINGFCSDLNKLVRKWHNTKEEGKAQQIEQEMERQYNLLSDAYHGVPVSQESLPDQTDRSRDGSCQDSSGEGAEPMAALLRSDKRSTKYYTVISKEEARKEIAGLAEYYPDHHFYAVTDIMDEDGEECFTMVMGDEQEEAFGYYPELDRAKTEEDRKKVMEEFLSSFEEYYIYSKPEDFFAR